MSADDKVQLTPHVVVGRFDKKGNLKARVMESASRLVKSLQQLGPTQCIATACDGSMCAFLVTTKGLPGDIYARLQAPDGDTASALKERDCVGVFSIDRAVVPHFSECTQWLDTYASPFRHWGR
jgi:hypothetical protein